MKRIIWVDDDIQFISNMREMFSDYGFIVESCTNLTEAYKKLKQGHTNNILVDVEFPNSNKEGITFLENIIHDFPNLNAVIYTAYPETDDAVKVLKEKLAADYIRKDNLLSKYKRDLFFKRLHENFKENLQKPILSQRFKSIDEFESFELKKWRKKTIYQLFGSLIVLGLCFGFILYKNNFQIEKLFLVIQENKLLAFVLSAAYGLINIFLIKDLYNKYRNYSNINNYIKRNIEKKIPKYLRS
ncbi:MAG: response regulator [Lewinellaceae bacterium]|nr:response regulator [Lewinellaceae bacterium]